MKRLVFIGFMGLLSMAIYAQNWTVDGNIDLDFYKWSNGYDSEDTTPWSPPQTPHTAGTLCEIFTTTHLTL